MLASQFSGACDALNFVFARRYNFIMNTTYFPPAWFNIRLSEPFARPKRCIVTDPRSLLRGVFSFVCEGFTKRPNAKRIRFHPIPCRPVSAGRKYDFNSICTARFLLLNVGQSNRRESCEVGVRECFRWCSRQNCRAKAFDGRQLRALRFSDFFYSEPERLHSWAIQWQRNMEPTRA
jgi:hypothetical protein